ncbi:allantoicase [Actinomycetospora sp. CA-084318]|uniref:allantoicase n=1 Tax=Actinomycetospora sp. CA-084318 TaxID=3239892 RepID=UPI003D98225A
MTDPTTPSSGWPDLARRDLGGAVVWANDEAFAARQNLVAPGPPVFDPTTFGPNGKVYDGWETRRRREPGEDVAVVRLAVPAIVHDLAVDTSFFTGNYPPEVAVDGLGLDGTRHELLAVSPVKGDTVNVFAVRCRYPVSEVRLRILPDGGVARLRVYGQAAPDPALVDALGVVDVASLELGGRVTDCSDRFYSSPENLLLPGPARSMGEGWETARRRDDGHDRVEIALACEATIAVAELDTSWFLHNAPARAGLRGRTAGGVWHELLPRTDLTPDTRHRFVLGDVPPVDAVRLDIHPDGGLARLRLHGRPTAAGRAALVARRSGPTPEDTP